MREFGNLLSSLGRIGTPAMMSTAAAMVIVAVVLVFASQRVEAVVAVTAATGGGAISTDTAATATTPAWTSLTSIVITEGAATDIAAGVGVTLILTAPTGFEFNTAQVPDVTGITADLTSLAMSYPTATTMQLLLTSAGTAVSDVVTIGGVTAIQVRPTGGTPATGNILRVTGNAGTAVIATIVLDTTNFGTLTSVVGVASKLAVTTEPTASTVAGVAIATQPIVTVQDQFGNTVTSDTSTVTLALTTGTGVLSGTLTKAAVAGVADFAGQSLSINLVGADKVLTATDGALTGATTAAFTITFAPAAKLAVTTEPTASTVAGVAIATQPIVTVQDAFGNTVTSDTSTVTLALTTGTGVLSGTLTKAAVAGVADFAGQSLSINLVGADKVLTATDGALTSATTAAFTITFAPAAKLAVTTEPSASTVTGVAFATQPIVTVQDAFGNTVTSDTSTVTLALTTGTGVLSGTLTKAAVAGVADFAGKGLSIDLVGADKVLTATDGALTSATTAAFAIVAAAAAADPEPVAVPTVSDDGLTVEVENTETAATSTTVEVALSTTASDGSAAAVTVPAGALPEGSTLEVSAVADAAALKTQAPPPASVDVTLAFSIKATGSDGSAVTSDFGSPVALSFTVDAATVPTGATGEQLQLAFWNGLHWVLVDGTVTVNADGTATIEATTSHFTLFAVLYSADGFGTTFGGELPSTGVGAVTFGGTTAQLETALINSSCISPIFVTDNGDWVGFIPTAGVPAVNAAFEALFADGIPLGTPMIATGCSD